MTLTPPKVSLVLGLVGLFGLIAPSALRANTTTVDATAVIYAAGTQS
jgi:hypothetical protein